MMTILKKGKGSGTVIQMKKRMERDQKILSRLNDLTYATREHLQILENLGGERNAQRIMQRLEREKYVSSVRYEKKIYYLSKKGQREIGSEKELKKRMIRHTIMRNDLYIQLGTPVDWRKEVSIRLNGNLLLVADAKFTQSGINHFVEIDIQQNMKNNADKIRKYKELFRVIFNQYKHHPVLIWKTQSEIRKKKLHDLCKNAGIKFEIY